MASSRSHPPTALTVTQVWPIMGGIVLVAIAFLVVSLQGGAGSYENAGLFSPWLGVLFAGFCSTLIFSFWPYLVATMGGYDVSSLWRSENDCIVVQGPRGVRGTKGCKGDLGNEGPMGLKGIPGTAAMKGDKGNQGTIWKCVDGILRGTVGEPSEPCDQVGDLLLDPEDGFLYECDGSTWCFVNPQPGLPFYFLDDTTEVLYCVSLQNVPIETAVEACALRVGDKILDCLTGEVYEVANANGTVSVDECDLQGPKGAIGSKGSKGAIGMRGTIIKTLDLIDGETRAVSNDFQGMADPGNYDGKFGLALDTGDLWQWDQGTNLWSQVAVPSNPFYFRDEGDTQGGSNGVNIIWCISGTTVVTLKAQCDLRDGDLVWDTATGKLYSLTGEDWNQVAAFVATP